MIIHANNFRLGVITADISYSNSYRVATVSYSVIISYAPVAVVTDG